MPPTQSWRRDERDTVSNAANIAAEKRENDSDRAEMLTRQANTARTGPSGDTPTSTAHRRRVTERHHTKTGTPWQRATVEHCADTK
jgi:hypothetical protein